MEDKKVLLVEDQEPIRRRTLLLLETVGYATVGLKDPRRIVEVATRERPRLIVQDLAMNGLALRETLQGLRENPATADIPILLFCEKPNLGPSATQIEGVGYLCRPFQEEDLLDILNQFEEGSKAAPSPGWFY